MFADKVRPMINELHYVGMAQLPMYVNFLIDREVELVLLSLLAFLTPVHLQSVRLALTAHAVYITSVIAFLTKTNLDRSSLPADSVCW